MDGELHGSGAEGHKMVTLSLTTDSGQVHESWDLCECSVRTLRERLGPPDHMAVASPEQVRVIAEHVLREGGPQL